MKHARQDYDRIQDPENKIPADEPVFLLRAQDKYFTIILDLYASLIELDPDVHQDQRMLKLLAIHRAWAIRWQDEHGRKTPDLPDLQGLPVYPELP